MEQCQLVVTGLQGKREILVVQKNCTIDQLYGEVSRKCAPGISVEELRLVYGGSELERGKGMTLSSYDIPPMAQIFMVIRLRGGRQSSAIWVPLPLVISSLTSVDIVSMTMATDIITCVKEYCIKMSCGHTIGPASLLDYCTSIVNNGHQRFTCPSCNRDWSFGFIRKALQSVGQAVLQLDLKVSENSFKIIPGFQKCPGTCAIWMYKDPTDLTTSIRCPLCDYRYCWSCLRSWKSTGSYCGNGDCAMAIDPRIQFLDRQPLKTIGLVSGCPSVRGCPQCGTLLEHKDACKHMACKSCKFQFCFVCLKPFNVVTQQWQCGAHNAVCPIASRQTTLPAQ